jgi:purine-binding chemotaxis protein CheW
LIFRLRDSRYAVVAQAVREIVPLPAFIPLDETPLYVVGVANLRGQIVPLIDLNLRFGYPPQRYRLEDCVVVLEQAETVVGLIVNEVRNVRDVAPAERLAVPSYGVEAPPEARFLTGLMPSGDQIVMLLHLEKLLRLADDVHELPGVEEIPSVAPSDTHLPAVTPQEIAVFRERALQLAQVLERPEGEGSTPLVVVRLGDEFFGVELQSIREFSDVGSVTPIPCCPDHILGLMNLRGELITVLDIAGSLGLPPVRTRADRKIVILNGSEPGVGVLVDEVLEVFTLSAKMLSALPTARPPDREYLQGAMPYGERMLSLLDLPSLLMQQNLIVNETP